LASSRRVHVVVTLVIVRRKKRPGVSHAHGVECVLRRLDHLLTRWLLARPPAQCEMHAVHFAATRAARLVLSIELHHAPRELSILPGLDLERKIEPTEPIDARRLSVVQKM
jgi:hypothetical protein